MITFKVSEARKIFSGQSENGFVSTVFILSVASFKGRFILSLG